MPAATTRTSRPSKSADPTTLQALAEAIQSGLLYGRVPLFVIGAGVSSELVPLLYQIGGWLRNEVHRYKEQVPPQYDWVSGHADAVAGGVATRRQAAELFSALQSRTEPFESIWRTFSEQFLVGSLKIPDSKWKDGFPGLCSEEIKPTAAHCNMAEMIRQRRAHAISLNFDGLTRRALIENGNAGLSLHTEREIFNYFAAESKTFIPAVFKIRGDVFFARCENEPCPQHEREYPLDHLLSSGSKKAPLVCPTCHTDRLRLQFSFPGYRAKEEAADPMLWSLRRFLGGRISAIVVVGLSGRWDRYLLHFLFDFAQERRLVVADVKPPQNQGAEIIDDFRTRYYQTVRKLEGLWRVPDEAVYLRVPLHAKEAIDTLRSALLS